MSAAVEEFININKKINNNKLISNHGDFLSQPLTSSFLIEFVV